METTAAVARVPASSSLLSFPTLAGIEGPDRGRQAGPAVGKEAGRFRGPASARSS